MGIIIDKSPVGRTIPFLNWGDFADWHPAGDFTFEFWNVIFTSVPSLGVFWSHYNSTGNQRSLLIDYASTAFRFGMSNDGTSGTTTTISHTFTPTLAVPYYLAAERAGSTARIYLGTMSGGTASMVASGTKAGALHNSTAPGILGALDAAGTSQHAGTFDAIRYTNPGARFNTNGSFAIPAQPLPTS